MVRELIESRSFWVALVVICMTVVSVTAMVTVNGVEQPKLQQLIDGVDTLDLNVDTVDVHLDAIEIKANDLDTAHDAIYQKLLEIEAKVDAL